MLEHELESNLTGCRDWRKVIIAVQAIETTPQ